MSTGLRTGQSTKANGEGPSGMGGVSKFGLMELATKVSGRTTKRMVKESSGTSTVTSLTESGKMIRPTATESTLM